MQKAKYNLGLKVTKALFSMIGDRQLFKGVKTLKSHAIEAKTMQSYCKAMYKPGQPFKVYCDIGFDYETRNSTHISILLPRSVAHRIVLSFKTTS